jgi:glycosyltransferase involved in cell wall biosynthesis
MNIVKETVVVLPTYNQAPYLDRCIRSLLAQSQYTDYEIICINDGSTDETTSILEKYSKQITILENTINCGLPFSINRVIKESSSRFIVRVDSDDYVSRHFLRILTLALQLNNELDAVACDYEVFDSKGTISISNIEKSPIACGIMFRRDHLWEVGLYDETFKIHEDKELMTRFEKKYKVTRIPIPLYRYRKHNNNLTNDIAAGGEYLKRLKTSAEIVDRNEK